MKTYKIYKYYDQDGIYSSIREFVVTKEQRVEMLDSFGFYKTFAEAKRQLVSDMKSHMLDYRYALDEAKKLTTSNIEKRDVSK